MTKLTHNNCGTGRGSIEFHADKPAFIRPKVGPAITLNGVKVYRGMGKDNMGKIYLKEQFDKYFQVERGVFRKGILKGQQPVLINQF